MLCGGRHGSLRRGQGQRSGHWGLCGRKRRVLQHNKGLLQHGRRCVCRRKGGRLCRARLQRNAGEYGRRDGRQIRRRVCWRAVLYHQRMLCHRGCNVNRHKQLLWPLLWGWLPKREQLLLFDDLLCDGQRHGKDARQQVYRPIAGGAPASGAPVGQRVDGGRNPQQRLPIPKKRKSAGKRRRAFRPGAAGTALRPGLE